MDWILLANTTRAPGRFVKVHLFVIDLRTILGGLNGATFPVNGMGGLNHFGEALYLLLVGLLWHLVGRGIDRRRGIGFPEAHRNRRFQISVAVATAIWGLALIAFCIALFWGDLFSGYFWARVAGSKVEIFAFALVFLWGMSLIGVGVKLLTRMLNKSH